MNRVTLGVLGTFAVILLLSGALAYFSRDRARTNPGTAGATSTPTPATQSNDGQDNPILSQLFGGPDAAGAPSSYARWEETAARISLRFSLAALLAGFLAFRPRRGLRASGRNPYVAQTQILMAVVASAMMMVVGDSAARAFGIFAAASLVRFRTNIRDPKEITVLLICLGVGLASGVGRWDMAVILTVFVMLALAVLEYFEQSQVFRSMEVKVDTTNVEKTNETLKMIFAQHNFDAELREMNRQDEEDPMGKVVYLVNLSPSVSTSALSEEIMAGDREHIDTVEWSPKVSETYIYK